MKIRIIAPIVKDAAWGDVDPAAETERLCQPFARPGTTLSVTLLERGVPSIETEYDAALALPQLMRRVREAEEDKVDAIVIFCATDPGLDATRELVSIPVVSLAQSSFLLCSALAHSFSVIAVVEHHRVLFRSLTARYGLGDKLASVRFLNIPVLDLVGCRDRALALAIEEAERAITEDGAGAIAFGCGGLTAVTRGVSDTLAARGFRVPVVDPSAAAIKLAEDLVDLGLTHSKVTHPQTPAGRIACLTDGRSSGHS